MNGMRRKQLARGLRLKFTERGLPRDAKDWSEEDWRDLYEAFDGAIRKIAARHSQPKGCAMPSHHHTCTCNGEGGDR